MRKLRLYIETSVWSHWFADDAPERRDETRAFFEWCAASGPRVGLYASLAVLREVSRAQEQKRRDIEGLIAEHSPGMLALDPDAVNLANAYAQYGAIPAAKRFDALHAAIASIHEMDLLISWNYRHLVNVQREKRINGVNAFMGYPDRIRIVTPPEVTDDQVQ